MAVNIYFPNMSNHRIKVRVDVDATHDPIQWAHQKTRICLNVTIPYNSVISCEATRNGNPVNPLQHRRHGDSMYAGQRHIPVLLEDEDARAQFTTGQSNVGIQCDGCPSYAAAAGQYH